MAAHVYLPTVLSFNFYITRIISNIL